MASAEVMQLHPRSDSFSPVPLSPGMRCRTLSATVQELDKIDGPSGADTRTVGVAMPDQSKVAFREFSLEAAPSKIMNFSDVSNPDTIKSLCVERIPGWKKLRDEVSINQLMEGLTNQLFKVSIPSREGVSYDCVLFRIYGTEVCKFYDPEAEFRTFQMLSDYRIAPKLIAFGQGWRIEEWHYSVVVPTRLLPNLSIATQVASALGRFHKLHRRQDFIFKREGNCTQDRLDKWSKEALSVRFQDAATQRLLEEIDLPWIAQEAQRLRESITSGDRHVTGQGYDIVFSHNDVQENNILQTQYGLRVIDFEYAGFNFQAFDIANFFCEFMIDYTHKKHPYYSVNHCNFPDEATQRVFAAVYLSEYLETPVKPTDSHMVEPLLDAVNEFTMVSHMLWGMWSIIRSPIAPTFEDFDFIGYAKCRFDMYRRNLTQGVEYRPIARRRKRDMLATGSIGLLLGVGLAVGGIAVLSTRKLAFRGTLDLR